ncbi:MAG: polysaccharide deacetylase family protein [Enterobacteriaceae bacterium]|jgi:peptidoglycan/xylan/chitin deacetylase (PgdA/CDA1 family)|nr:polysaccharide deacetylase family protein [Enterobacteriaceae bacterium]
MSFKRFFIALIALPLFMILAAQNYALAEVESRDNPQEEVTPVQVRVVAETDVSAQIGDQIMKVGHLNKDDEILVYATDSDNYQFTFGNAYGFIPQSAVTPAKTSKKDLKIALANQRKINQNLITVQQTPIYNQPKENSSVFGMLEANLRYPIIGRLSGSDGELWYEINIGDNAKYILATDCEPDDGLPVLTYHHILTDKENINFRNTSTTTSNTAFDSQMAYLKQAGYQTISMYQLEGYVKNTINLPAKAVVLTFDDGLKSVYRYAYPILKKYDFEATAFIISSRIKRHPQAWDSNSLQFMSISELEHIRDVFDIQSHTHFLHRFAEKKRPVLLSRSEHNIELDLERSSRALSQFNPRVIYVSYPFGGYDENAIQATKQANYHMAVTTVKGKVRPGDNPFTLKRLYILRSDSISDMAERISNSTFKIKPIAPNQD